MSDIEMRASVEDSPTILIDFPPVVSELVLGWLPFDDIARVACTCTVFRDVQLGAADCRRVRLNLKPLVSAHPTESPIAAFVFSEALSKCRAAAPGSIAAAELHSLVLQTNCMASRVLSWGSTGLHLGQHDFAWHEQQQQQLTMPSVTGPALVAIPGGDVADCGLADTVCVAHVSAGLSHSVALSATGAAYSWGYSSAGALGHGSVSQQPLPLRIVALCHVAMIQVSCSERHTLFLSRDGAVFACGDGHSGRLGLGGSGHERIPRAITTWQKPTAPQPIWTATGGSCEHSNLTSDDAESEAEQADLARALRDFASGADKVKVRGQWVDAHAVCALDPSPRIICVSAGECHSHAISAPHGHLFSWGLCTGGRLGLRRQLLEATPGSPPGPAVARRGAVCRPMHADLRDRPGRGLNFHLVSAGDAHSLAIDARGGLYAWGRNVEGQLGLGDEKGRARPTRVTALLEVKVRMAAAGTIHSACVGECGAVYTWGIDAGGRLGHGDGLATSLPRRVASLNSSRVVEVATAREHTLFRLDQGTVLICGKNDVSGGRLGVGAGIGHVDDDLALQHVLVPQVIGELGGYGAQPSVETLDKAEVKEARRKEELKRQEAGQRKMGEETQGRDKTEDEKEVAMKERTGAGRDDEAAEHVVGLSTASSELLPELVLRNVDVALSEGEIAEKGSFRAVMRMARAGSIDGSRPIRPLPLVRVTCQSMAHASQLLAEGGLVLGGRKCAAEVPVASADSSAALGKRAAVDVASLLCRPAVAHAQLIPTWRSNRKMAGLTALHDSASWRMRGEGAANADGNDASRPDAEVIVCSETSDYHRVAVSRIDQSDVVLEIGSDLGAMCALAWPRCGGRLVGVDLSDLSISRACAAYPHIKFVKLDALQVSSCARLRSLAQSARAYSVEERGHVLSAKSASSAESEPAGLRQPPSSPPFTKVFVDINGNRLLPAVAGVLDMVLGELQAPFVCCKSRELHAALVARRADPHTAEC